jgi:glyoxylase-like metal-dependent hydrolase (beta-lactamase superfamily II)
VILRHFITDTNESNVYLVACTETREAMLVDAGSFPADLARFVKEQALTLRVAFITHNHYDHTDGLQDALTHGVEVVLSGSGQVGGRLARHVGHGDTITVGQLQGEVRATPGHTPDSLSLVFPGVVFTGDALFAGSVGGTGTAAAAQQQLDALRDQVLSLPPDYEIHPGHGPASTVAVEKRYNPFFT